MSDISSRHHYVPIFMAKNFSKENGKIIVYDKTLDKKFKAKPKNVFLESDRNTFLNQKGKKVDIIEKIYSDLDNQFAKVIHKVKDKGNMSGKDLKMLLFLAYIMKWRVPQYDESFVNAKNFYSVADLGLGIKLDDTKLDIELESEFETELHQELKRFLLAIQPFRFKENYKKISKNSFLISTPFNGLIGDCPVNEIAINSEEIFEDFVFPITEFSTLVYSQRINKLELKDFLENGKIENVNQFLKDFSISRDLSTMALSGRFSGCSDNEYLDVIINGYKTGRQNDKTKDALHTSVFNVLYRYDDYK